MKKILLIAIFIVLAFMSLVYMGVFRDNQDPLVIARYYLESIRDRQGFLTFQISTPEYFDEDKRWQICKKYKLKDTTGIIFKLHSIQDDIATVNVNLTYSDGQFGSMALELKKIDARWLLNGLR